MATEGQQEERAGVVDGIKVDVVRLHETWMELLFPRQRGAAHSVLGKWKPTTTADTVKYRLWAALGVPIIALLYPLALAGFAARFYSRRIDRGVARVGLVGVVLLAVLAWGALTFAARVQFGASAEGFYAVAAASLTAVLASVLAVVFTRVDGRPVTVLLAYPFGMTAIFLPPVVAALYSPVVADAVLPGSYDLAVWFLDNVAPEPLAEFLRGTYDLEGVAYVLMWFGIAVPLGWLLGLLVSLADVVRPKGDGDAESSGS
ncbi:hypothetical protein [Halorarius halobius]|uniref:hypothetical protein n=1 Tax=Halorarius halobius TaxID=2962671 RepID=UPI0020CC3467|nr:hypothetical protein [Halorarius halobius]